MRIYFDPKISVTPTKEGASIYSPSTHARAKVNPAARDALMVLIQEGGHLSLERVCAALGADDVSETEILDLVSSLEKAHIIFRNEDEFEQRCRHVENTLCSSNAFSLGQVYFHPTLDCNFRCTYCYNRDVLGTIHGSRQSCLDIADRLSQLNLGEVVVTGGEPLIHPDIEEILCTLYNEKTKVTLLTNGSLLPQTFLSVDPFVTTYIVSMDSLPGGDHETNRSAHGLQETLDFLIALPEEKKKKVRVRSVLTKGGLNDMLALRKALQSHGIAHIWLPFLPNSACEAHLFPEEEVFHPTCAPTLDDMAPSIQTPRCGAGMGILAVVGNGDIYPCQNLIAPQLKLGNIMQADWQNKVSESCITTEISCVSVDAIENCKNCDMRYVCGGGCRAIAYKNSGSFSGSVGRVCSYLHDQSKKMITNWREPT